MTFLQVTMLHNSREKLRMSHRCQKECYDKRIHGKPFKEGDLVWLHSPVVLRGQSRKLHHSWTGPFKIVEQISESNYKIRNVQRKKKLQVVHFDRLKLCTPGTRFSSDVTETVESSDRTTENSNDYSAPDIFGQDMELVESGPGPPVSHYPRRDRNAPDRYACTIAH